MGTPPPSAARTKGYAGGSRGVKGRVAHAGGGHIPHVGGEGWGKGIAHNTETPPALPAIPSFVCSGAAAPAPRTAPGALRRCGAALPAPGDPFTCTLYLGHPPHPKRPPSPNLPVPSPHIHFFSPSFLEKTHPGASAPPQPPPPPVGEGGRDTAPPPRSSPPPRCSGAQPPAGVGDGGGGQPDPKQGGSKQRLRGTGGWGRGKARRMRGQGVESDSPSPPPPLGARPLPPPAPGAWYLPNGPG